MVSVVSEKRQAHFWRFILKKQLSLVIALATANMALANDAFDQFLADTTVNVKARSALIKLDANDVAYDASGYDAATATTVLFGTGANAALGSTGTGLDALAGADPATVQAALADPTTLAGMNQFLTAAVGPTVVNGANSEGTLNQAGSALWLQIESGYLYDVIGFDLGLQGAVQHFKDDDSSMLIIADKDDETYSRIATARIKAKYNIGDVELKANYGRYSEADETDYLMDSTDMGYGASAQFKDFTLTYEAVTASAGNTESELVEYDTPSESIELKYQSDFGKATAERSYVKDVEHTDSYSAVSGLPMAMLGLPISDEHKMDYLLIAQVDYATRKLDADSDFNAAQYEIMLAAKLDGLTLAASYNKANEDGGADVANLIDNALINDFDRVGQSTISYVVQFDGEMVGLNGLSVSAAHFVSSVNKDDVLATGDLPYFLAGDAEFTETLVDAKYTFSDESFLKGLSLRTVFGRDTNEANITGYGVFVDYNVSF